ncbi:hypothetical protein DERF_016066 [Dermatophagoides farinae]|uniref:Uncharacterized protein n=1 Tax=Dermatophagoides farinae TaxID=6954 RepID=A0A922HL49_DERFA|nr:hypothetical protein DERF_016066 [Dermatophagoides farinae]
MVHQNLWLEIISGGRFDSGFATTGERGVGGTGGVGTGGGGDGDGVAVKIFSISNKTCCLSHKSDGYNTEELIN